MAQEQSDNQSPEEVTSSPAKEDKNESTAGEEQSENTATVDGSDVGIPQDVPRTYFKLRGVLIAPPVILAMLIFWQQTENPYLTWGLGGAVVFLGFVIRVWAQQHLFYRVKRKKTLTKTGPYGLFRNPFYVGNTLLCVGAVITSKLLWLAPLTLIYCYVVYTYFVIRYEEMHLLEKYGEPYKEYFTSVNRWWPTGKPEEGWQFFTGNLGSALAKEIHNFVIVLPFIAKEYFSRYWM